MSSANSNLDISTIDSDDYSQLSAKINTFYSSDSSIKTTLSYNWERNQLMLDGKQWLSFNGGTPNGGQWAPLQVSARNEYIPRPVTNYLFSCYQTLKSYLVKNKPRSTVYPNTQERTDKTAAKIATLILEANWERLKETSNYESAASILITYGTVFKKSFWDTSTLTMVKVPKTSQQPITDPNTGMPSGMQELPEIDPETGLPIFIELPLGDINTTTIDPYRIAIDPLAMNLHEAKWIMEYSIMTLDMINQEYGKEGDGFTGRASEVKEDTNLNTSMRRWYNLKLSSGVRNGMTTGGSGASDAMVENSAVVKEYYERPSGKYPKGRLVVVAGTEVLYSGESPYSGPEQGDWHPYSECRWETFPGRFWGKGPLDDAIELQKRINTIDSTTVLTRKTMAMPQRLIPIGSGIAINEWTGRPGQNLSYRDTGTGSKPEIIPGIGPDSSVFQERAQCVEDLKELTGAVDILRGDKPPGVNAASALSLLYEIGTGKLYPTLDRWKYFIESDQKKQLRLISQFYKEPRPEFIKALKAKNTDLLESDINKFIGQDLNDNSNVVVEAGSNIPKLQAAKQAMLIQAIQLGIINVQDPQNLSQIQNELGLTGYDSDIEPDKKRALWENDLIDDITNNPMTKPVVLAIDNHMLHKSIHETRMKSPTFMSAPVEVQRLYMEHIKEHEQFEAMAEQAAIIASGGAPVPPPTDSSGATQPTGGGLNKEVKAAIQGGPDLNNAATIGLKQ
jgi:hypothetical protein